MYNIEYNDDTMSLLDNERTLVVAGLPSKSTFSSLSQAFKKYGAIDSIEITEPSTKSSITRNGVIVFKRPESAKNAFLANPTIMIDQTECHLTYCNSDSLCKKDETNTNMKPLRERRKRFAETDSSSIASSCASSSDSNTLSCSKTSRSIKRSKTSENTAHPSKLSYLQQRQQELNLSLTPELVLSRVNQLSSQGDHPGAYKHFIEHLELFQNHQDLDLYLTQLLQNSREYWANMNPHISKWPNLTIKTNVLDGHIVFDEKVDEEAPKININSVSNHQQSTVNRTSSTKRKNPTSKSSSKPNTKTAPQVEAPSPRINKVQEIPQNFPIIETMEIRVRRAEPDPKNIENGIQSNLSTSHSEESLLGRDSQPTSTSPSTVGTSSTTSEACSPRSFILPEDAADFFQTAAIDNHLVSTSAMGLDSSRTGSEEPHINSSTTHPQSRHAHSLHLVDQSNTGLQFFQNPGSLPPTPEKLFYVNRDSVIPHYPPPSPTIFSYQPHSLTSFPYHHHQQQQTNQPFIQNYYPLHQNLPFRGMTPTPLNMEISQTHPEMPFHLNHFNLFSHQQSHQNQFAELRSHSISPCLLPASHSLFANNQDAFDLDIMSDSTYSNQMSSYIPEDECWADTGSRM